VHSHDGHARLGSAEPGTTFDRLAAVTYEIESPRQVFRLTNLHLMTPRFGLQALSLGSIATGEGPEQLESHTRRREAEAAVISEFIRTSGAGRPQVVCGDFNMPSFSSIYRSYFAEYINAFEDQNFGYGFTAPCNTQTLWPNNLPWVRIDHVLTTRAWSVRNCRIGKSNGSDHRMVACELQMNVDIDLSETSESATEPEQTSDNDHMSLMSLTRQIWPN